jgi:hypothetical protein
MYWRVRSKPSVGPYWSASAEDSCAMRIIWAANDSGGKVEVSGSPPASEITSGRAVIAIRSAAGASLSARAATTSWRSRSREVVWARRRRALLSLGLARAAAFGLVTLVGVMLVGVAGPTKCARS